MPVANSWSATVTAVAAGLANPMATAPADGEFVHAAPWSNAQQGHSNVLHGCVNLSPANAQWFYDHFGLGDVVTVTHSSGPPLPVWDTYGDWALSWAQWQAGAH